MLSDSKIFILQPLRVGYRFSIQITGHYRRAGDLEETIVLVNLEIVLWDDSEQGWLFDFYLRISMRFWA
jgi:hypothetical protein